MERSEGGAQRCLPGARLGRYELIAQIGAGGMAEVWIARMQAAAGFSKLVAIKTILPHLAALEEAKRMLFDEARVAARIHHPNVVAIQELGEEDGLPFVVMEWVDGLSLDRVLAGDPLSAPLAARIVADACAGLHAAHELTDDAAHPLHVVHRDISPFNLILGRSGAVKVADFGIVKARGQLHRTTTLGELRGRVPYMAPEQITAQAVDRRADIFSLGATLHEMLTGELAFDGSSDVQIIYQIIDRGYCAPPVEAQAGAEGLFAVVTRALARTPDDRYPTAEAMRLALEAWLAANAPPIVTSSSIAELVQERVGRELEQRQRQLRAALASKHETKPHLHATLQGVAAIPVAAAAPRFSWRRRHVGLAMMTVIGGLVGWVSLQRRGEPVATATVVAATGAHAAANAGAADVVASTAVVASAGVVQAPEPPASSVAGEEPLLLRSPEPAPTLATSATENDRVEAARATPPRAAGARPPSRRAPSVSSHHAAPLGPDDELPANPY